jgi:glycosyltransferase involved in cell wall biosynthesis
MDIKPKVSISLPCYNCEAWISETIESILNQTYKNYELILVDDGSTDHTRKIVKKYLNDTRIKYLYQSNKGFTASTNLSILKSTGKYIGFIGHDDLWESSKLQKQVFFLERNPHIDFIHSDLYHIDSKGNIICRRKDPIAKKVSQRKFMKTLFLGNFICFQTVLVKRKCFEDVGLLDERIEISSDYDLWLRMAQKFRIGYLDEPLVKKRYHENNLSYEFRQIYLDHLKILEKALASNKFMSRYKNSRLALIHATVANEAYNAREISEAKDELRKALRYDFSLIFFRRKIFKLVLKIYSAKIRVKL